MSTQTNAQAPVDVLALIRDPEITAEQVEQVCAAVTELIEADREVDAIEDEMRRAYLAGARHDSYGTGWELRDLAAKKDRERRHEAAHKRRAAALARFGGA